MIVTALVVAFRYGDRSRWTARMICLFRGGDASHVEVAAMFHRPDLWWCVSSSWVDKGVRATVMPLPAEKWRLYQTDVPVSRAEDYLLKNDRKPYGWWKLLRFVSPMLRPSWGGPICTEAVARILGMHDADSWDVRALEAAVSWRWPRFNQQEHLA